MINLFIGVKDARRLSHRCNNCGLINSFSFTTRQNTCIACSYPIDDEDLLAMKKYKERSVKRLENKIKDQENITSDEL